MTERERNRIFKDVEGIRKRCKSLHQFIREAWHVLEPTAPFVDGWHIAFICAHLEAITWGKFLAMGLENRLLINVPPGTMKSLIVSVFWPAWEWGPCEMAAMRYFTTSYTDKYVKRDSRRMRDLVRSEWYQAAWGNVVQLVRVGEASFSNNKTGWREGVPFVSLTGGRGDRVIIDDPHSTETAESDAERETTTRLFRESVPLRVNDPVKSAIVVIMQRLHAKDVSGVILDLKLPYIHIRLPMEYEAKKDKGDPNSGPCETPLDEDPRTYDGELLWPERYTRAVVERDKVPLSSFGVAGQFQQRPSAREGGKFKRHWFEGKIIKPALVPARMQRVRHWDLAGTKKSTAARTAGVRMGHPFNDPRFIIESVITEQEEGDAVRKLIKLTAQTDSKMVAVSLPQDPGQAGKVQAQDFIKMLVGWTVQAAIESGDKNSRASPFATQCEAGNVYLVEGDWNEALIDELCAFPTGKFKDRADACSGAFGYLVENPELYDASQVWAGGPGARKG